MKRYALLFPTLLWTAACSFETGSASDTEDIRSAAQALTSPGPTFTVVGQTDTGFIPPDTDGAVSSSFIVTTTNNAINVKDRRGNVLLSQSLFTFWSSMNPSNLTDPRVKFDPFGQRFVVTESADFETPNGRLFIAVSKTADPTAGFFFYQIPASPAGNHWLDFPQSAINSKWLAVSGDVIGTGTDPSFIGLWAFDKSSLYSGGPARFTFINLGTGTVLNPAETYDGTTGDMFVCRQNSVATDAVDLYRLSGAVGSETLTFVSTIASPLPTTTANFFLPQAGGTPTGFQITNSIESPSCVFRNGSIWTTQEVIPATGPARLSVQWLQIASTGTLQGFGRVDDPTGAANYFFPTIAVNKNNEFIIGFTRFSADTFPSAAYAVHLARDAAGTIEDPVVYHAGAGTYSITRWGDYSHSQIDPTNDVDFWTIQEATQSTDSWVTWWAQVPGTGSSSPCNESNAIDLGAPGNAVTVATNACLRVRDGFPFWWGTHRPMLLQDQAPGNYPVPFTWSNTCSGGAGTGTYTGNWQTNTLTPTSSSCAVVIQLQGTSSGHITLWYFGGN